LSRGSIPARDKTFSFIYLKRTSAATILSGRGALTDCAIRIPERLISNKGTHLFQPIRLVTHTGKHLLRTGKIGKIRTFAGALHLSTFEGEEEEEGEEENVAQ
jgi:hypothetical protein